jgi:hypothetical protein
MARAEKVACRPGDGCSDPFPDSLETAPAGCKAPSGALLALQAQLDYR